MDLPEQNKGLAVITGASTGIGLELARLAVMNGYDAVIAADEAGIELAADELRRSGRTVHALQTDLSTRAGVSSLIELVSSTGRPVELLMANVGRGLGHGFLDQNVADAQRVVDTNISGTLALVHSIANGMRVAGNGRILFTGSIAGFMPGAFQAVYNGTKAFINSFSFALREEVKGTGITVTCLMPGPTDTEFFNRADMLDTAVAEGAKDDAGSVAKAGFEAMLNGEGDVVTGWKNKLTTTMASITPSDMLAKQHRKMAEPGMADDG